MPRLDISLRLTQRYRDGWSDLDEHEYLGSARIRSSRVVHDGDGYDDEHVRRYTIELTPDWKKVPKRTIGRALSATFSGSSCQHEHDCCGCWSSMANVKRRGRLLYDVEMRSSRNV